VAKVWPCKLAGPFGCRCPSIPTKPRFHSPLIEPDVRICRIRLSDQDSRLRSRRLEACRRIAADPASRAGTIGVTRPLRSRPPHFFTN